MSLNLAYESADIAASALQALSSAHIEALPPTTLRPAKSLTEGEKIIEGLKMRIAFMGDKRRRVQEIEAAGTCSIHILRRNTREGTFHSLASLITDEILDVVAKGDTIHPPSTTLSLKVSTFELRRSPTKRGYRIVPFQGHQRTTK